MYHLRLKGSHYQMGVKRGKIFQRSGVAFPLHLDEYQLEHGRKSEKILKDLFPEVCEEIRGVTDITGVPYLRKGSKSELYSPANGNRFTITTSSFINGEEGMNEHGLAVAMTFVMTRLTEIRPGLNSCFIVRYLLEKAESTADALSMLVELPVASNCNILLADKHGEMLVAECTPSEKRVRQAAIANGNKIVCTVNSFTSEKMKKYDASEGKDYCSDTRYHTVMDGFCKHIKGNLIEATEHLLRGDYGFMCQYDEEPDFETVWSSVFDLKDLRIYRAEGDPRRKKFITDSRLHDMIKGK